jgi:signal transduction histidine kinase
VLEAHAAKILIVDDEIAQVRLLEILLVCAGYVHLRSVTDSRDALPLYEAFQPDLVLLDLYMPHLDGFEVLARLRARTPDTGYVPVLVLTAAIAPDALRRALGAGAADFLVKPADNEEILLRVRNLLHLRFLHQALQHQNQALEERVRERTQREREARERLQVLSRQLVDVQEAERRGVARELHDQIGQMLTGLRMTLRTAMDVDPNEQRGYLATADELARELLGRVRALALDLRPAMLDDLGLVEALLWHHEQFTARTGVRVVFKHSGLGRRLPGPTETAAYRIVQESLTNVARHAQVDEVEVQAWTDGDGLLLQIEDHGGGFDPEAALARGTSSGLSGMRERAAVLGGWLRITSAPGESTTVTAMLPVHAEVPSGIRLR